MTDDPSRDFANRAFPQVLKDPDNLREFLESAIPELAKGFDCSRAKLLEREFILPDWRGREADLLFEIPYRIGNTELIALVCLLLEHQTRADSLMPIRTLVYTVLYWDRCLRTWVADKDEAKGRFFLPPVVPIVLHSGQRPWGSAKTLAELLGEPAVFHQYAPIWEPIFWELSDHSVEELLNSDALLFQALSVVRVEEAGREEFGQAFKAALKRISEKGTPGSVRWSDLVRFVLGWPQTADRRKTARRSKQWRKRP